MQVKHERKPCKFYFTSRGCPMKNKCKFSHDEKHAHLFSDETPSSPTQNVVDTSPMSAKKMPTIPRTACYTAAVRAQESTRSDRLFHDPFAAKLCFNMKYAPRPNSKSLLQSDDRPLIQVRTRFIDDFVEKVVIVERQVNQMVILGAGMDARAYRLNLPADLQLFELDTQMILEVKQEALRDDLPKCRRSSVPCNLATDNWQDLLLQCCFDPSKPTLWLCEGVLQYLTRDKVTDIMQVIDSLSAPGSHLYADIYNPTLLRELNNTTQTTSYSGAYKSAYEYPEIELFKGLQGTWSAAATQIGEDQANFGRYMRKPTSRDTEAPRIYFVRGVKTRI